MSNVIVVGGGAAGMMAAIAAAKCGHNVTLLEKNEKLGKKLFITGKGRCNVTNGADMDVLFQNVCTNEKFLYSVFVLSVEIVGLREAGREKSVAVSPGAVISLVESRIQVGEVFCRAFQTAIKGERPMIIQFIAQIHGRIEEQERTLL